MKRSPWLARLAVVVWLAWLGLVGLMFGMLKLSVWHPHFLPATALLTLLLAAALTLSVAGGWRLIRGPRRVYALSCLLLGLAPMGFFAAHFMYGFRQTFSRQLDWNLPLKALIPIGDSILELVARLSYPQRTLGERVVMISAPLPEETARQQVALMDRHIRELESRLHRTGKRRVYWVRGPLLGIGGKAINALCMGTRPDESEADSAGLATGDRHEVAHVVLSQFSTMDIQPPALLSEGWAQANSGIDPNALLFSAQFQWEAGETYSLSELLGPDWYSRHEGPAYDQGALLVDYILREFGPDRFLSLYTTCRQATFDADCRRILGVTVEELDKAYWADIQRRIGPSGISRQWLRSLKLDRGVDQADWERFISDYFTATERALAPYECVRLSAERAFSTTEPDGGTSVYNTCRYDLKRSGPLRALKVVCRDGQDIYLAHPEHSFRAGRNDARDAWEIREDHPLTRARAYRKMIHEIGMTDPVGPASAPLFRLAVFSAHLVNPLCLKVAKLKRQSENGRPFIWVELEDCPPGHPYLRKVSLKLSAEDYLSAHAEYLTKTGETSREDIVAVYDSHEAVCVVMSTRSDGREVDGTPTNTVLTTITSRRFGPVPEEEFTPERLLDGAPAHRIATQPRPSEVPRFLNWYPLPVVLGVVSVLAGASLLPWARHREGPKA